MGHWNEHEIEERLPFAFHPDTLAAADYFESLGRRPLDPSRKLMLAVLEDAVKCFLANAGAPEGEGRKLFEEAEQWILDERGDWLFSFESICTAFALNPEYVRQGLLRWKQRKSSSRGGSKAAA
ncbi:MAG TPA: hypothetical protein VNL14_15050 [Candidatus Acidoferrales bacterium]|nr:hypothetical protein [Candidatus Acidoferrales bacterium]